MTELWFAASARRSALPMNDFRDGDAEIGRLIATAMEKVGKDGVITVEAAKNLDTELEVVEGMLFDRGHVVLELARVDVTDEREQAGLVIDQQHSGPIGCEISSLFFSSIVEVERPSCSAVDGSR